MYFDQEKLTFFDFDDSSYKHFLSDIAIIIYYSFMFENASQTEYNQKVKEFLSDFLIGYQKENDFDLDFFVNINDFILLRSLVLYIVVIGSGYKISDDPQKIKFAKLVREAIFDNSKKLDVDFLLDGLK